MLAYAYIAVLTRSLAAANQALRNVFAEHATLQEDFVRTFVAYSEKTVALEEANDAIEDLLAQLETARSALDFYRDTADAAGLLLA